jgi:hypothetical protein
VRSAGQAASPPQPSPHEPTAGYSTRLPVLGQTTGSSNPFVSDFLPSLLCLHCSSLSPDLILSTCVPASNLSSPVLAWAPGLMLVLSCSRSSHGSPGQSPHPPKLALYRTGTHNVGWMDGWMEAHMHAQESTQPTSKTPYLSHFHDSYYCFVLMDFAGLKLLILLPLPPK